jgi:predicted acylesterase/phospholipase RssA
MNIKNLVLSGGGTKGFCFYGAIEILSKKGVLENINTYIGTSAGSGIMALLCMGYTYQEFHDFILAFNFEKLKPKINVDNILEKLGVDNGNKWSYFIRRLIKEKTNNEEITFQELYELTNKTLIITATCISSSTIHYLSYKTTPTMPIWLAIRMSTSVPLLFEPVLYNGKYYIDGGMLDNFPIQLVDDITQTIGIATIDRDLDVELNKMDNILDYCKTLFNCVTGGSVEMKIKKNINNIITINTSKYNLVNYDLTKDTIEEMYNYGKECATKFFENYKAPAPPTIVSVSTTPVSTTLHVLDDKKILELLSENNLKI